MNDSLNGVRWEQSLKMTGTHYKSTFPHFLVHPHLDSLRFRVWGGVSVGHGVYPWGIITPIYTAGDYVDIPHNTTRTSFTMGILPT